MRELQAELARLAAAKERRAQKYQAQWSERLKAMTDEQNQLATRNAELLARVKDDVQKLEVKEAALEARLATQRSNMQSAAQVAAMDAQRRRDKARRQLEADERAHCEKLLAGKLEGMKAQAAKAVGAQLDALVIKGKEAVRARAEELEEKLATLKVRLQADLDVKVTEAVSALRAQHHDDVEKQRRFHQRKVEETKRRHEAELAALRERLVRSRQALEDKAERARAIDADAALENLRAVRAAEAQQVADLVERHQRDIAALVRANADELAALARKAQDEADAWRAQREAERREQRDRAQQHRRDARAARAAAETERIVGRLRAEADAERRRLTAAADADLERLRAQAEATLDALRDEERRSRERLGGLATDVDAMRRKLAPLEKEEPTLTQELEAARGQLKDLRVALRDAEADVAQAEARGQRETDARRQKHDDDVRRWEAKAAAQHAAVEAMRVRHEQVLTDARDNHREERRRVEAKVAALMQRKEAVRAELEHALDEITRKGNMLHDQLEKARGEKFK